MEVKIIYHDHITKEEKELVEEFVDFLEEKFPLKKDVVIDLLQKRTG